MDLEKLVPVWLLGLFSILVVFIGDVIKGGWKQPMTWVVVVLGQVLCFWIGFDAFAKAGLTPAASIVGIILTGLLLTATAAKVVYPASSAVSEIKRIAEVFRQPEGD